MSCFFYHASTWNTEYLDSIYWISPHIDGFIRLLPTKLAMGSKCWVAKVKLATEQTGIVAVNLLQTLQNSLSAHNYE